VSDEPAAAGVTLRIATASDADVVIGSWDALVHEDAGGRGDQSVDLDWARTRGAERFAEIIATPASAVVLIARHGDTDVGVLGGSLVEPTGIELAVVARLANLYVRPEARGLGAGRALIGAFSQWARDHGAAYVQVSVYADNADAIRLYQRCGLDTYLSIMRRSLADPS
jgi:GNAT superfamily N-acetyltransferase